MSREVHQSARVIWAGTLARGSVEVTGGSGALGPLDVDLPTRLGEAEGKTTPEELLAAAHATCFTTALGSVLAGRRTPPARLEVRATVTLIELETSGEVPGADEAAFGEALSEAEARCLISRVLAKGTTIRARGGLA